MEPSLCTTKNVKMALSSPKTLLDFLQRAIRKLEARLRRIQIQIVPANGTPWIVFLSLCQDGIRLLHILLGTLGVEQTEIRLRKTQLVIGEFLEGVLSVRGFTLDFEVQ